MTYKAILFDKDGTLIDFAGTFFQACATIIEELAEGDEAKKFALARAVDFDLETISCPASSVIIGGTSDLVAQAWQPLINRPSQSHLRRELDDKFDRYTLSTVTAFEFTKPTLQQLADLDIPMGIATNDSENNARNHLRLIEIEEMFSFIAGYDSGFGAKPEPGMVKAFADHAGTDINQVAMVGDSINDLIAGKRAGATAVAVASGIASPDELHAYADHVISDISKLPELLFSERLV